MSLKILIIFILFTTNINFSSSSQYSPFHMIGKYRGNDARGNLIEKSYYVPKFVRGTWIEALFFCKAFNMELASFYTLEEYNKVRRLKANHSNLFTRYAHIGGMANKMNKFDWFWVNSDEKIAYDIPWSSGEPNNSNGYEWCLSVGPFSDQMEFNDLSCYNENADFNFICQKIDSFVDNCS